MIDEACFFNVVMYVSTLYTNSPEIVIFYKFICWVSLVFSMPPSSFSGLFTDLFMLWSLDVSTDGIWCYIILWVTPRSSSHVVRWVDLKGCLLSVCPPLVPSLYTDQSLPDRSPSPVYLLKFCSLDRKGLLHGTMSCLFFVNVVE